MATEVKIPALGESITSGILAAWHVESGQYVESGDTLYDLETDKITSEGTAEVSGTITLEVGEGDEVEIGQVVATIDESGSKPKDSGDEPEASKEEEAPAREDEESGKEEEETVQEADTSSGDTGSQHPPSVRRIAAETGIDPSSVEGTGKSGRVTKADMLKAEEQQKSGNKKTEQQRQGDPAAASSDDRESRKKMSPLRKTIANRLVQAQQSTAMLTTFNEADMSKVMAYRKEHQDAFIKKHDVKLGFMSFFVKAAVHALQTVPAVNARLEGDEIVSHHYYDIGVAVSTPRGLMVPVLRDCHQKSFAQIEKDLLDYAGRAKEGKIGIEDLQGGVFTISNGGIFGSMLSTPILNSPQSAILGMHTIQDRPVAVEGEVVIRPMMYLALSYDHRLVDGREAVGFLVAIKQVIEDPARLLFEL